MAELFALARQHSASRAGQCLICQETVGEGAGEADVRMGCGCALHYSCLVNYLHSKLGDRGSLSLRGICCPNGAQCVSFASVSVYYITLADLDNLVDYARGAREGAAALLIDNGAPALTHEKVAELRAWLEESAALEGLRVWLSDSRINDDERGQLVGVRRGEPAFDALVQVSAGGGAAPGEHPELTADLADSLHARLQKLREGYKDELDPFVAATTKVCPTCSMRSTHWHGHQCHHISPVTRGCPSCHVHFCYRCLATEADNERERAGRANCLCGYWSNFCRDITTEQDVAAFVAYKDGIPFDSRCGCVICPECRFEQPCPSCPGNCGVCRGVLNPAPGQANPASKWVALRLLQPLAPGATLKARLWEACRQGNAGVLAAVVTEAGEGAAELVNGQDREGRTCLDIACDASHAECVAVLIGVPGIDPNRRAATRDGVVHHCCSHYGLTQCLRALLTHPSIDVNSAVVNESALQSSCEWDHPECTALLLSHPSIDVNKADSNRNSALVRACYRGHTECVRLLCSHRDIKVNQVDGQKLSALCWSVSNGHIDCMKLLLAHADIDVNYIDDFVSGALVWSIGKPELLKLLLAHPKINANQVGRGFCGRTALMRCCQDGHAAGVALFLAHAGIDANYSDSVGINALSLSSENGHTECVRLLLAHPGIVVTHSTLTGKTALDLAANDEIRAMLSSHLAK